jgi:glucose-1-phosphate cytidylyltransferase
MKTVILCGGKGSRLREETDFKPKPMVEVGGRPILWHIMKIYASYGYNEFILALGYKGNAIKDYFLKHYLFSNDFTLDAKSGMPQLHGGEPDDFKITFVDTGPESFTGERLLRLKNYIAGDEFMVTYGDGVSDINVGKLVDFHRKQGTVGTISGFHHHSKYGLIKKIDSGSRRVLEFDQKPLMADYVSGGFMVFGKKFFDYLDEGPMEGAFPRLIKENQLSVYLHDGFWRSMDTYQEMEELNKLWETEKPWAVWDKRRTS